MLLQPLVENAIEHGIKPTGRPGCVSVNVTGSEDIVEIRIQDNGIGFQNEQFNKIISQNVELENEYGLRNVAERLKLYYNENCQLKLESVEEGTSILIRIANSARKDEKNV